MSQKAETPATKTFPLKKTLEVGGKSYSELDLREPTCEEMERFEEEAAKGSNLRALRVLISAVTGIDKNVVARVEVSTVMEAGKYLTGFIPGDQTAGEN